MLKTEAATLWFSMRKATKIKYIRLAADKSAVKSEKVVTVLVRVSEGSGLR